MMSGISGGVSAWTAASGAGTQGPAKKETSGSSSLDLYEMMKDAREQAEATREKFQGLKKGSTRYGDAPIEAYARLARARRPADVNAAAGYARRPFTNFSPEQERELLDQLAAIDRADGLGLDIVKRIQAR